MAFLRSTPLLVTLAFALIFIQPSTVSCDKPATGGPPAADSPAGGAPASGAPASGAPASGAPASGAPASGAPASGAPPAGDSPAGGAPASGAPAGAEHPEALEPKALEICKEKNTTVCPAANQTDATCEKYTKIAGGSDTKCAAEGMCAFKAKVNGTEQVVYVAPKDKLGSHHPKTTYKNCENGLVIYHK